MELVIKKCMKCGAIVIPYKDCECEECGIKCCGEEMRELIANSEEASFEKHVPTYEIVEDEISVTVNHVMEKEHYIEFIALVTETKTYIERLYPEMDAQVRFKYVKGATLYAYCNKHGLWMSKVDKL